jgi:rhodanese-related sulfurtransferase
MKDVKELLERARSRVKGYDAREAIARWRNGDVVFVDVRNEDEIRSTGRIPKSTHASRGLLEFHLTADSPHYQKAFAENVEFIFYSENGQRSALAAKAATELGLARVANLEGGIRAWRTAGGEVESLGFLAPVNMADLSDPFARPAEA